MLCVGQLCGKEGAPPQKAVESGGARRDRTADLVIANDALSQLSYGPAKRNGKPAVPRKLKREGAI
jgi:hypothetical protein